MNIDLILYVFAFVCLLLAGGAYRLIASTCPGWPGPRWC